MTCGIAVKFQTRKTTSSRKLSKDIHAPLAKEGMGGDEGSTLHSLRGRNTENETNREDSRYWTPKNDHKRRLDNSIKMNIGSIFPF